MKRILCLLLVFVFQQAQAQVCEGDTSLKAPVFYPSVLPAAITNELYDEIIQIRTVKDTMVLYNNVLVQARFDSIKLKSVGGLPDGFTYACGVAGCTFVWDETRCVKLSGLPQAGQEGYYPLTFYVTAYVTLFGSLRVTQEDSLKNYAILVSNDPSVSVPTFSFSKDDFVVYPNPSSGKVTIFYETTKASSIDIRTYAGQRIDTFTETDVLDLSKYARGLYWISLNFPDGRVVHKQIALQNP
jgi:hypothetical protein